uniref:Uncharacterized protein n=1 Tax=Brassica oleracea TaxID=3712 RepID=A0A3P6G401_BRAOL|nr:unnamed protein product [Brassica oleracea]
MKILPGGGADESKIGVEQVRECSKLLALHHSEVRRESRLRVVYDPYSRFLNSSQWGSGKGVLSLFYCLYARGHPISLNPKVFLILDKHSLSSIHFPLASRKATALGPRSASSRPGSDQLARLQLQLVPARVRSRFSWWSGFYNMQTKGNPNSKNMRIEFGLFVKIEILKTNL